MRDFYSRMQDTANRLLQDKGQAVVITRNVSGAYDPATGQSTVTTTTQTGWGAVLEYSMNTMRYGTKDIGGGLILAGDKELLLSAINSDGNALVAPHVDDTVTVNGTVFTITMIKPLAPNGTTVLFDCNLRGAA